MSVTDPTWVNADLAGDIQYLVENLAEKLNERGDAFRDHDVDTSVDWYLLGSQAEDIAELLNTLANDIVSANGKKRR